MLLPVRASCLAVAVGLPDALTAGFGENATRVGAPVVGGGDPVAVDPRAVDPGAVDAVVVVVGVVVVGVAAVTVMVPCMRA